MYMYLGTKKKKVAAEDPFDPPETSLKKKTFPGLCIPDNPQRAQSLLNENDDVKVATEALVEASAHIYMYNIYLYMYIIH